MREGEREAWPTATTCASRCGRWWRAVRGRWFPRLGVRGGPARRGSGGIARPTRGNSRVECPDPLLDGARSGIALLPGGLHEPGAPRTWSATSGSRSRPARSGPAAERSDDRTTCRRWPRIIYRATSTASTPRSTSPTRRRSIAGTSWTPWCCVAAAGASIPRPPSSRSGAGPALPRCCSDRLSRGAPGTCAQVSVVPDAQLTGSGRP